MKGKKTLKIKQVYGKIRIRNKQCYNLTRVICKVINVFIGAIDKTRGTKTEGETTGAMKAADGLITGCVVRREKQDADLQLGSK